jgi:hypothetical protein
MVEAEPTAERTRLVGALFANGGILTPVKKNRQLMGTHQDVRDINYMWVNSTFLPKGHP